MRYVLDACSLINLYSGTCGRGVFVDTDDTWFVGRRALDEVAYVREFSAGGAPETIAISSETLLDSCRLGAIDELDPDEWSDFAAYARDVDDGEAEALAIARSRDLVLVTDDGKAARLARELSINCVSTVHVLKRWCEAKPSIAQEMPRIVHRIETLARYRPSRADPDVLWWEAWRAR